MTKRVDRIYEYLANEEDARVCVDISEDACREVPGNFIAIFSAQVLSKLADSLASAKVVIPWFLTSVGAPAFFVGVLVPIREAGSLLPQLLIGGYVRSYPVRKWFFVAGSILQGLVVGAIALAVLYLDGLVAGVVVTLLLVLFSLARGLCSVAAKDVLGKTISKQRRGLLTGYCASAAGAITIFAGGVLASAQTSDSSEVIWVLFVAALSWIGSAFAYARITEFSGESEGGGNALKMAYENLTLLKTDNTFARFVLVRALLMGSGLASPYFIMLARQQSGASSLLDLGIFVVAGGSAGLVSGVIWGKLADVSSRKLMFGCGALACLLCSIAALVAAYPPIQNVPILVGLFFLLCVTHEGVRLGRKIYIVDIADGNRRTDYVAVSNTLIGGLLLIIGSSGALLAQLSIVTVLLFYGLSSLLACIVCLKLPEA